MIYTLRQILQDILEKDLYGEPRWKQFAYRTTQIVYACIRDLTSGQLSLQAMGLVYMTLITLVPLLAISFSVLKGFGIHNRIEPTLLNLLAGLGPEKSAEVTQKVLEFVDNIQVSVLGALGFALLIYAVISLMQKIETAFNFIWRVGQDRNFARRFSDYLSVLLMGPFLIFISAGITTTIRHSEVISTLLSNEIGELAYDLAIIFIPWFMTAIGFTFVYTYIPNTKVKLYAAFSGGLIAALIWKILGFVFASFIAGSANYVAIYAAFATLIVLIIWLYASWLVILVGANIAFYIQYPRYLRVSREFLVLTPHINMTIGLNILDLIGRAHYSDDIDYTLDTLSKKMNTPILAMQEVLEKLEAGDIIAKTHADPPSYIPARPFEITKIEDVLKALETQGAKGWMNSQTIRSTLPTRQLIDSIYKARYEGITHKTLTEVFDFSPVEDNQDKKDKS